MLNLKSAIVLGLFPISLCIGLGVLLYNMYGHVPVEDISLTREQIRVLWTLRQIVKICFMCNALGDENIILLRICANRCIELLIDPVFIRSLRSFD